MVPQLHKALSTATAAPSRRASTMPKKLPGPGDGELFWRWLVIYPAALAVIASETSGLVSGVPRASRDPLALPHAFVAACFGLASLQCVALGWYARRVEGDLGYPGWVHRGAGALEAAVVALRVSGARDGDDARVAVAAVLTGLLMGGAAWTWLVALRRPSRFLPAALILGCTFATRPNSIPTAMPAFVAAISAGALSAGAVRFLFVKAPKKKKKAVASKDD